MGNKDEEVAIATVKAAFITGILGIIAAVITGIISGAVGKKQATQEIFTEIENGVANINGDNASVVINDIDDLINDYESLKVRNEGLVTLNEQYAKQIKENELELQSLRRQQEDTPVMNYKNLALCINGENISINTNESMVSINGREYVSREFVDNILADNETLTIKDDTAYIGRIIADQSNLFDQWVVDSSNFKTYENLVDSYGNQYFSGLGSKNSKSFITYNLNNRYSLLKLKIAVEEDVFTSLNGTITIKADDNVVYVSPEIGKKTAPFEVVDIPINNCSLLTIEGRFNNVNSGINFIISDAFVYN